MRTHLAGRGRLNVAAVLFSTGAFVLLVSLLADWLAFGSSSGFGYKQFLGLGVAGILVLLGALMRIPTMFVIGLIVGVLALLADWLGFGNATGFGWQQITGVALGCCLLACGAISARARRDGAFEGKRC
jgi:hypothetical protein